MIVFMEKQGYKLIGTIGVDDIFIKPDKVIIFSAHNFFFWDY